MADAGGHRMKKPTIKQLEKLNACNDGVEWYKSVKSQSVSEIIDGANKDQLRFCNWYISRALNSENRVRYAIYAAEKVLHIFEEKYPDEDRPIKAIQAAKDYLAGKISLQELRDVRSAASAASAAYAAYAAAYAAYAAAYAAADAADAAADAAAYSDMLRDIVKYGISLMEEQ
jgi:hypothetical protein